MLSSYLHIFFPLLLNLILSRLIIQTDIIMVSRFGASATAAFTIPNSVMFIDQIVAFALVPIMGVKVAESAKSSTSLSQEITKTLGFSLAVSSGLTVLGLIVYPYLVSLVVHDRAVLDMGTSFVIILTLAIVPKFLQFIAGNCLHAIGKGKKVVAISITVLALNFIFNYLFMFRLRMGPSGCYWSTLLVSFVGAFLMLRELKEYIRVKKLLIIDMPWMKEILHNCSFESLRLSSERILLFTAVCIIGRSAMSVEKLEIYGIVTTIKGLLTIPLITNMRATAIFLTREQKNAEEMDRFIKNLVSRGLLLCGAFGIAFAWVGDSLGKSLYNIVSGLPFAWWHTFTLLFTAMLVFDFIDFTLRGILQHRKQFRLIAGIDIAMGWLVFLPIVILGVSGNSAILTWGAFLACSVVSAFVLARKVWIAPQ